MLGHVLAWPDLLEQGFAYPVQLPATLRDKRRIVCCGMGGSAIGAGVIGDYLYDTLPVSWQVVRDYVIPAYVDDETLVICLSYSGGTEETLACYESLKRTGAAVLAVSTGGELVERAQRDGLPSVTYPGGGQPRAALPLVLGLVLTILHTLDYIPSPAATIATSVSLLRTLVSDEDVTAAAADQAARLTGRIPLVYGAGFLAEAARRLKGQISENGKQTAAFEAIPEHNHNAIVGYEFPADLPAQAAAVQLRASLENPRHRLRFEINKDFLKRRGIEVVEISSRGDDSLQQLTSQLFLGDLLSVYLAYANGTDPTPVDSIITLKQRLADEPA